jgi:hypothetical protein
MVLSNEQKQFMYKKNGFQEIFNVGIDNSIVGLMPTLIHAYFNKLLKRFSLFPIH